MCLLIVLSAAHFSAAEVSESSLSSMSIPQLIDALTDADLSVRRSAAERLTRLGMQARPAVIAASRGEDPEQRAQAANILKRLPWWTDDDPADVRALLERYGDAGELGRSALIRRLRETSANNVLLRLLQEEPNDGVRWNIVGQLWIGNDDDTEKALRQLQPPDNDAPTLTLAGRIWIERDKRKGLDFLRRAIEADEMRPSDDGGLLGFAFDQLTEAAMQRGQFDEAAAMLRRHVPRDITPRRRMRAAQGLASSLAKLLALHEYFGPLDRYESDLQLWSAAPARVDVTQPVTRLFAFLGHAPPLPIGLTAGIETEDRYFAARFLLKLELAVAAELELRAAHAQLTPQPQREMQEANILFLLGQLVGQRDEDLAAADYLSRAISIAKRNEYEMQARTDDDILAEISWRRARAAQNAGDTSGAETHAKTLLQYTPANTDSAIKMVNWLFETKRDSQAKALFDKIYQQSQAKLESTPDKSGLQNDLAWLCVRTGQRLDEAFKLAQAAVEKSPENASFLDTLAECHYRLGHRDEAIKVEKRALELEPNSKFFREQVDRFTAGQP